MVTLGLNTTRATGGPAPEKITDAIYNITKSITEYNILEADDLDLDQIGESQLGDTTIAVIDSVADYAELMCELFDFDRIKLLLASLTFGCASMECTR